MSAYYLERIPGYKAKKGDQGRACQSSWVEKTELRVQENQGGYSSLGSICKRGEL